MTFKGTVVRFSEVTVMNNKPWNDDMKLTMAGNNL